MQRLIQRGLVGRVLGADRPVRAPLPVRLVDPAPAVQTLPAWLIGVGLGPEHVVEDSAGRADASSAGGGARRQ